MPRVHINVHDIDEIEDLEDWENLIGLSVGEGRRDQRSVEETRARGERRFGGAEVVARKRADRRKNVLRGARRV